LTWAGDTATSARGVGELRAEQVDKYVPKQLGASVKVSASIVVKNGNTIEWGEIREEWGRDSEEDMIENGYAAPVRLVLDSGLLPLLDGSRETGGHCEDGEPWSHDVYDVSTLEFYPDYNCTNHHVAQQMQPACV